MKKSGNFAQANIARFIYLFVAFEPMKKIGLSCKMIQKNYGKTNIFQKKC